MGGAKGTREGRGFGVGFKGEGGEEGFGEEGSGEARV